jgi:calcineurin-like phosphoesterase family protein
MSKLWFTSDTHFNHKNIIQHCRKSFSNVDEMNEQIIHNWNKVIQQDDMVYLLGDVAWSSRTKTVPLIYRLKGRIFLIRGNHDQDVIKKDCVERFEWVKDYYHLNVPDPDGPNGKIQPIILFHYPIASWNHINHGAWHLHGHCHGNLPVNSKLKRHDVGIDNNLMHPISYERIKEIMATRKFEPVDHHEE